MSNLTNNLIVYQTLDDLKKSYANNNQRRLKYGIHARRGIENKERILNRRKEKNLKKGKIKERVFFPMPDECHFLFYATRKYNGAEHVTQISKARSDFAAMPYDFDTNKNALVIID